MDKYKILSLDGGGTWAIIQLLTLKEKYGDIEGHKILKDFDMVIANSGGSIILAALVCNWKVEEAIKLFDKQEYINSIFNKNSFSKRYFPSGITRWINFGPKYSAKKKFEAFKKIFNKIKDKPMEDLPEFIGNKDLKIIVSAFDSINNKAKFFKSYSNSLKPSDSVTLLQAIHASSNAPVNYFDLPAKIETKKTNQTYYMWDGALGGFNNPVAAGIIEAFRSNIKKEDIVVISIGTSNKTVLPKEKHKFIKLINDLLDFKKIKLGKGWKFFKSTILELSQTILNEPPDWANYVAYVLLFNEKLENKSENIKQFIRLSPMIYRAPNNQGSNNINELIDKLYELDMDLTRQKDIDLVKECFKQWKEGKILNQPIKGAINKNDILEYAIGHKTFKDVFNDWKNIS